MTIIFFYIYLFTGSNVILKFSAFRHCFANFRHNVSLAMFRFLGTSAASSCRHSPVVRPRSQLQFSSLRRRVCQRSSPSLRSLRAVLGPCRPVNCLRHAGNTCEYKNMHKISVFLPSCRHNITIIRTPDTHQVAGTACSQSGTLSRTPSSASITGSFV